MYTNYLFRRTVVIDCLIRRISSSPRLSCSKNSDDTGNPDLKESLEKKNESETVDSNKNVDDFLGFQEMSATETDSTFMPAKKKKSRFAEAFEKYTNLDFSQENERQSKKEESDSPFTPNVKLSGFAKSFEKFSKLDESVEEESESDSDSEKEQQTFASLIRNSKFVDLGDPEGKVVIGNIYHIVEDDLYIDFGWKFPTVCQRPIQGGENYIRGAKVRLLIKDLELSTRFLGATKDITLREADCVLLGLVKSSTYSTNFSPRYK